MRTARTRPGLLTVTGVLVLLVAAVVGWFIWNGRQVWSRLDSAADDFGVPEGFIELERVRSGEAVCFVTCTGGGEALVTILLDPGSLSEEEACRRMEAAVRALLADAGSRVDTSLGLYQCDLGGPLDGTMRVAGVVERTENLCEGCGERWLDDEVVPEIPLVAWVEFNSGIE